MKLTTAIGAIVLMLVALLVIFNFGPKIYTLAKLLVGETEYEIGEEEETTTLSGPEIQASTGCHSRPAVARFSKKSQGHWRAHHRTGGRRQLDLKNQGRDATGDRP